MVTVTAKIRNEYGIHVRPSALIVKSVQDYKGTAEAVSPKGEKANLKNVLSLISLGMSRGQEVTIRVSGPDETETAAALVRLFETTFDCDR